MEKLFGSTHRIEHHGNVFSFVPLDGLPKPNPRDILREALESPEVREKIYQVLSEELMKRAA